MPLNYGFIIKLMHNYTDFVNIPITMDLETDIFQNKCVSCSQKQTV